MRILVIEDDKDVASFIRAGLAQAGANVDHAANWFDTCSISEADRQKIGRTNSMRLFKLGNE